MLALMNMVIMTFEVVFDNCNIVQVCTNGIQAFSWIYHQNAVIDIKFLPYSPCGLKHLKKSEHDKLLPSVFVCIYITILSLYLYSYK